ncbi:MULTISPECIES: TetR/AcrR family transcriptional regulator [unclassified Microbacterium]|uniref:TetR/AcrR family transcriptional regulator n=1 Tax=unclassified Microbacterium TaxID=2609290 RepID=UPI00214B2DA9|nr:MULTISPECIES: TetR/AcrR family transcriptional regulator [unclassified Microbacterium]MCR2783919.1 TetR/AcrR family transcriptional regulator [Microbacterium sp. zg.B96]WIM15236.1 TetR/AcrR family transcriptional regulator [Microbacterium sp. zg-B96]
MEPDVKTHGSSYRQEQAEATRVRIAEAAQGLFARDGYAATSMDAIAKEAGVGNRTVYAAFGAKREILNLICERWLERADARGLARGILAEPDPVARVRGAAHWLTVLYATDFDVVRILDTAMDEDADTRAVLRAKLRGRNRVMDQLIASVEESLVQPLADAQAIYRAFAAPGVFGELVVDSGWEPERFEEWLAGMLVAQLLRATP